MNASLIEMVLAIVIAGIIFASAIIPTTQMALAYQEAEAEVRQATSQATASIRPQQLVASIWRDASPPANHDTLVRAQASRLTVGNWDLRGSGGSCEQKWSAGGWTPIATPVASLSFEYLLNDGTWAPSVGSSSLGDVLAVRFAWNDPDNGRKYGGLIVAPDRSSSAGLIQLLQPDTSSTYQRSDYERTITFSLGSWQ